MSPPASLREAMRAGVVNHGPKRQPPMSTGLAKQSVAEKNEGSLPLRKIEAPPIRHSRTEVRSEAIVVRK